MTEKKGGSTTSRLVQKYKEAPPQVSAGLTVLKREVDTEPVDPHIARMVTKSRAQKFLRKVFNEARFQTVMVTAGAETWQLWCKGAYGRMTAIVEVTAPPDLLPYSVTREALKRVGQGLTVSPAEMKAFKLPDPPPATP